MTSKSHVSSCIGNACLCPNTPQPLQLARPARPLPNSEASVLHPLLPYPMLWPAPPLPPAPALACLTPAAQKQGHAGRPWLHGWQTLDVRLTIWRLLTGERHELILFLEAFFDMICLEKNQHIHHIQEQTSCKLSVVRKGHMHVSAICTAAVKHLHLPQCFGPCFAHRLCKVAKLATHHDHLL